MADDEIDRLIAQRKQTHGVYAEVAAFSQATKNLWRAYPGWGKLTDVQRDTLEHIVGKVGRALCGDSMYKDHWVDCVGYLKRVLEEIDEKNRVIPTQSPFRLNRTTNPEPPPDSDGVRRV